MAAKPIKSLELHYTMIQFLIKNNIPSIFIFYIIQEVFHYSSFHRYSFQRKLYTFYTETKHNTSGLTNLHRPKIIPALFRLKEEENKIWKLFVSCSSVLIFKKLLPSDLKGNR